MRKLKGRSADLLVDMPAAHYDVIYIDGSHEAGDVLLDAMLSWPLLKHGGVPMFDDYLWMPEYPPSKRPQLAIDVFLNWIEGDVELLHKGYQLIVRKGVPNRVESSTAAPMGVPVDRA